MKNRNSKGQFTSGFVCGVGIFDPTKKQKVDPLFKKAENIWRGVLGRCYNKKHKAYKYYGKSGITVSKDWHKFSNFFNWFKDNYIEGRYLDKDLLPNPNKEYSCDTCCFVTRETNNRFSKRKKKLDLPEGVHKHKSKYCASISINNKKIYLTRNSKDINMLSRAYLGKKIELIEDMKSRETDPTVIKGLEYQKYKCDLEICKTLLDDIEEMEVA
jgi:hypothetical protein